MRVEVDKSELEQLKWTAERSDLLDAACGVGLWQAILKDADAMHPESRWSWSPEFRRLLGFESAAEFPDLVTSWSDRLHPEDIDATFAAFGGHLTDKTGKARYDVSYRLKMRDGSYRWFRATGGCMHMPDGQIRACGSLCDIHDATMIKLQAESEARDDAFAVSKIAEALEALSHGNLTCQITDELAPKMQRLKDDFNSALAALSETMTDVTHTAAGAHGQANSMRQASGELSARSAAQASSIEETSAAVVEITSTVKQTADLAKESAHSAEGSREKSQACSDVVQEAVAAMEEIEKSSEAIGSIIGTIENIAFQTNMLALNAAVEAARAGDAGRGFAIVASEVRSLAQRSTEAAKEIADLITSAKSHVSNGVGLVQNTGESIKEISVDVAKISESMSSMSQAAAEQSMALSEIERAIADLDQLTQQNSAMAQHNEEGASQLTDAIAHLEQVAARFKIDSGGMANVHAA